MAIRHIYLLSTLFLLAVGCRADTDSVSDAPRDGSVAALASPACHLSPDTLDFGRVLTPIFGWETDYEVMPFTIANMGDSLVTGRVTIAVEPTGPRAAKFALTPPDTDPVFSLQPGDSVTFVVGVTMENASGGNYTGTVGLGTFCAAIPLFMNAVPSQ
jgi:hypothetical protein